MTKRLMVKIFFTSIMLLACRAYSEDLSVIRNKDIEQSGMALSVQNLWLGQDVKGQSDVFTNDIKEIVYYASFKNLTNINLFQEKIYTIEWIDPKGEIYFSDTVATAYGNNNLVYSKLKIQGSLAHEKLGTWACKFYKKGVLFDEKHFLLEVPGAEEKRLAETSHLREEAQLAKMKEIAAEEAKRTAQSNVVTDQSAIKARPADLAVAKDKFDATAQTAIRNGGRILIVEPQLVFENAYTEQRMGASNNSAQVVVDAELPSKATEVMVSAGLVPISVGQNGDLQKEEVAGVYRKLQQNTEELIKQWKDKTEFTRDFKALRDCYRCDGMLVQFVRAKIGAGGGWDFVATGTVVAGTSTTTITAALINLSTGSVEWSNSVIERDTPQKHIIKACIDRLFNNFPGYSKK